MDVALTGATGAIGSRLLGLLLDDPDVATVRSVARRDLAEHPKLVHTRADLCDPQARQALLGCDVLYHLAFQLWRSGAANALGPVNVEGTRNVLAAGPGRVVLASSAAVYGAWPDNPLPLTETSTPRPNAEVPYARHKLVAERLCADAAPTAALRISAVLGPSSDHRVKRSARGYRVAVPAVRGVHQALQFLDEDDAAGALHAAGRGMATGVFNVATDDWLSESDIARLAGGRVVRMPLRAVLAASEAAVRLRLMPFGADRSIFLNGPLALDPSLAGAADALGWRPSRSSADVLAEFVGRAPRSG
ncbi:MAG: NAD-dependent epimerase/dehydratase family protein [Actinomycetota bacterium]|nr:NAD-dependent epimerase/dehydratase family protein [Actinomycetota bacterium]